MVLCCFYFTFYFRIYLSCVFFYFFFFFNDTATTEIYTLSLHDALPHLRRELIEMLEHRFGPPVLLDQLGRGLLRSEEHTSELQSLRHLVCRLLLEKKKKTNIIIAIDKKQKKTNTHHT